MTNEYVSLNYILHKPFNTIHLPDCRRYYCRVALSPEIEARTRSNDSNK